MEKAVLQQKKFYVYIKELYANNNKWIAVLGDYITFHEGLS